MKTDIGLYVILDASVRPAAALPRLAVAAVAGGATILQYRDKAADGAAMLATTRAIRQAIAGRGVPLLVNDRVDVAALAADGVHLGQDDLPPAEARRLLPAGAIVGRTVKSAAEAEALAGEPVDYACVGAVYATSTKAHVVAPIGVDGFAAIRRIAARVRPELQVGAIAGIHAGNAAPLFAAGADGVAVVTAVLNAPDPEAATCALRALLDGSRRNRG